MFCIGVLPTLCSCQEFFWQKVFGSVSFSARSAITRGRSGEILMNAAQFKTHFSTAHRSHCRVFRPVFCISLIRACGLPMQMKKSVLTLHLSTFMRTIVPLFNCKVLFIYILAAALNPRALFFQHRNLTSSSSADLQFMLIFSTKTVVTIANLNEINHKIIPCVFAHTWRIELNVIRIKCARIPVPFTLSKVYYDDFIAKCCNVLVHFCR